MGTGGQGRLGRIQGQEAGEVVTFTRLTCQRAHPRLRASAAMYLRTLQRCGCLSIGRASRASAVARRLGSGSSIMMRTDRSSEDRPVHRVGLCQGRQGSEPSSLLTANRSLTQVCSTILDLPHLALLTGSEFRGQIALAQLLPALSTMGQLHVACHFQDGETQTGGEEGGGGTEDRQG